MRARPRLAALLLALILPLAAAADPAARIALIIDDLGDRLDYGRRAVELPGAVTYAFLPHTPYARRLAEAVHTSGREVMLHLPMESVTGKRLGPGGVTLHMTEEDFRRTVAADLDSVPYARGINNHMGSLITRHPGHMNWLMQVIAERQQRQPLFFVDSLTTHASVARQLAYEHRVPNTERDIFLDNVREPEAIRHQFARLVFSAHEQGSALGIGHPYPSTLAVLEEMLSQLAEFGVELVPVSRLIDTEQERRIRLWQASLSPSPKAAKSSKQ